MSLVNFFKRPQPKQDVNDYFEQMQSKLKHTPDVARLGRRQKQLIFVYDDLMRGHPKHELMTQGSGSFQATAFTQNTYSLWKKKLGKLSYPVAIEYAYSNAPQLPVKGELYSLDTDLLIELDKHKENMSQFIRTRVTVQIPYRAFVFLKNRLELLDGPEPEFVSSVWLEGLTAYVTCWMYVGSHDYWNPQLDAGYLFSPITRFFNLAQSRDYYYNTIMEYDE